MKYYFIIYIRGERGDIIPLPEISVGSFSVLESVISALLKLDNVLDVDWSRS